MNDFESFNLSTPLLRAIEENGFKRPTPIQAQAFSTILAGKDLVGIAQTGTGKTLAYILPLLRDLKYSKQVNPRILVLVPTRELVVQVLEQFTNLMTYLNLRILGVFGGVNINTQMQQVAEGCDILVATPGRLYDLVLSGAVQIKTTKKVVIDEVDVMLDLGFRYQLTNIFELLPDRHQSLMFSATMTDEVDAFIDDFFIAPVKISIAVSGTPLENIQQRCYPVKNFYTKVNLLSHLLSDSSEFQKVLVFVSSKKQADRLFNALEELSVSEIGIVHSNKTQNHRFRTVNQFNAGDKRLLVSTDVMARGLDLDNISHVICFDTPRFPENYMHRIGRTGRAEKPGISILFFTENEIKSKEAIERLMDYQIPMIEFPSDVPVSYELIPEERPTHSAPNPNRNVREVVRGPAFHEKKEKNKKTNQGGSYLRKMKAYKKPKTRGDKIANKRRKRK